MLRLSIDRWRRSDYKPAAVLWPSSQTWAASPLRLLIKLHRAPRLRAVQEKRKAAQRIALAAASRLAQATRVTETLAGGIRRVVPSAPQQRDAGEGQAALILAAQNAASKIAGNLGWRQDAATKARMQAMQTQAARQAGTQAQVAAEYFETELVINDFPQAARYHVTHRDTIAQVAERTGAPINLAHVLRSSYRMPEFVHALLQRKDMFTNHGVTLRQSSHQMPEWIKLGRVCRCLWRSCLPGRLHHRPVVLSLPSGVASRCI